MRGMNAGRCATLAVVFSRYRLRQLAVLGFLLVAAVTVLRTFTDVGVTTSFTFLTSLKSSLSLSKSTVSTVDETSDNVVMVKTLCQRPHLELNNPALSGFFKPVDPLDCGKVEDMVCVGGGKAWLCDQAVVEHPNMSCQYTFFDRVTDHTNREVSQVAVSGKTAVTLLSDFFHVRCEDQTTGGRRIFWKNIMMGVHGDDKVFWRTASSLDELQNDALGLNVLMFGFDSISRFTFMRKLPLSYKYLTEELDSVVLKGYNIVGDGTPQALIPILTGFSEPEMPETRKRMGAAAMHVNVYPFVWRKFENSGYVTAYAEDSPSLGTFTYRLKGFDERPTDHYLRSFYVEYDTVRHEHQKLCIGSRPAHKVMMDWAVEFFDFYLEKPKFFFGFQGDLSHDDINMVEAADKDFVNFLRSLKEREHLNNTMLIVMSDHGHRFSALRETQQGKQEERLPFFSFVLPPWFKAKYPKALRNLKTNVERLTTPFDIHSTLQSVLRYKEDDVGTTNQRGISLFSEVPPSRRCEDADIEPHWCTCLSWEPLSTDDNVVHKVSEELVNYINGLTEPYRSLCHKLVIAELVRADKYTPQSEMLHYKKNSDLDGFEGDFSDNTTVSEAVYQVAVNTEPGGAHYEASIVHRLDRDTFDVTEADVSRVNAYGSGANCIMDVQPDLRKYCYCRT